MLKLLLALMVSAMSTASAGIVADTVFCEARGESFRGRLAVATVIWNRHVETGRSLENVCMRRRQFSCWNGGYYRPEPSNGQEATILAELELLERDMYRGTFQPSGNWNHYYNPDLCSPSWADYMADQIKIGRHIFGRL